MRKIILLLFISQWCFGQNVLIINNAKTQFASYDVDYQNVLAAAQAKGIKFPSLACMDAQNALMISIKANVGLSAFDQIKNMLHDGPSKFSDINWANPAGPLTVQSNNPLYVPLSGFSATNHIGGTAEYLNMGKLGGQFTQNSCEIITYYRNMVSGTANDGGQLTAGPTTTINSTRTSTTLGSNLNANTNSTFTGFDLTDGLYFVGRTSSSSIFGKKGSGSRVTVSSTSTGIFPYNYFLLARNGDTNGTPTGPTGGGLKDVSFFSSGRLLTTTEETNSNTAWNTYMTAIAALPAIQTVGTKYNISSVANLNDFTSNGCTVTATSNQLQFTGGANTFTQSLDLTSISGVNIGATKLSKWTQTIQFVVPTITGSTNWIGVGLRSSNANANYYDLILRMDLMTATAGVMHMYSGPTHASLLNSTAVSITAGDIVSMTFTIDGGAAFYSGYNVTTSSTPVTGSFALYGTTGGFISNTGHFAIFNGGNANVTSWTVSSTETKSAKLAILGDSKTQCYQATGAGSAYSAHNGFPYLIGDSYGTVVNLGGSSDRSADYITRVWEIINWIQPQTVVIAGVCNDIRAGVANPTWQANINSVVSQLQAAGIRVIFWTGIKENFSPGTGIDQAAVSTWANAGIGCEVWDSLVYDIPLSDFVHPTTAGHVLFSNYALSYGKLY